MGNAVSDEWWSKGMPNMFSQLLAFVHHFGSFKIWGGWERGQLRPGDQEPPPHRRRGLQVTFFSCLCMCCVSINMCVCVCVCVCVCRSIGLGLCGHRVRRRRRRGAQNGRMCRVALASFRPRNLHLDSIIFNGVPECCVGLFFFSGSNGFMDRFQGGFRVWTRFTGFFLPSFSGFYLVLLYFLVFFKFFEIFSFLLGFTEFQWVCLGFASYWLVLPSFT